MKFELTKLEQLTSELLSSLNDHKANGELLQSITKEIESIKQALMNELFSEKPGNVIEHYVQFHQKALLQLMQHVESFENLKSNSNTKELKKLLLESLNYLLQFIEK